MDWRSKLLHAAPAPAGFSSLAPATHRGSTTVLPDLPATANATWRRPYSYGLYGTPTALDLAQRICTLCGGSHTFIVPSGQAAITLVNLSLLRPGDHMLLPANIYGTSVDLAEQLLQPIGIEVTFYNPLEPVTPFLQPNTRLVWFEAPGSITMEVPDLHALTTEIHHENHKRTTLHHADQPQKRIITAIDDTYSSGVLMRPFDLGIDIAIQALTKYAGGHSDLLLGAVTLTPNKDAEIYEALGSTSRILGYHASPDDCTLALRGLQTLAVRLEAMQRSTLQIAEWCQNHPAVERVLHPAFPSCPGNPHFQRLFTGSASIFSIVLKPEFLTRNNADPHQTLTEIIGKMKLFKLGYSWGGTTSVVMAYPDTERVHQLYGAGLIRFGIGLEHTGDLIADIEQALQQAPQTCTRSRS